MSLKKLLKPLALEVRESMKAKQNKLNKNWVFIKIILINWLVFGWIILLLTGYYFLKEYKLMSMKLNTCQNNITEIEKQIDYGVIQLKLKK